jgi:hypothetical protein
MDIFIKFLKPLNSIKADFGQKHCRTVSGELLSQPVVGINYPDPYVEMKPTKFSIFS